MTNRISEKQRLILDYIRTGQKTKREITSKFKYWYYYNAAKHIGDVLKRMVDKGLLIRVKHGVYGLGSGVRKVKPIDVNQLKLF